MTASDSRRAQLRVVNIAIRLCEALDQGLPVDDLPHLPSGRTVRDAADEEFPSYAAAAAAEPESWRAQFRLGLAYDASGDRRRARASIREAIRLYRLKK